MTPDFNLPPGVTLKDVSPDEKPKCPDCGAPLDEANIANGDRICNVCSEFAAIEAEVLSEHFQVRFRV